MKKQRLLWLAICVAVAALVCAACGGTEDGGTEPAAPVTDPAVIDPAVVDPAAPGPEDPQPGDGGVEYDEAASSLLGVRQMTLDSGCACAVAFVAYVDISGGGLAVDPNYQAYLLEDSGFAEARPFVKDITGERVVETTLGQELYCVVPLDSHASVAVNALDAEGNISQVIYRSESGEPILLRCDGFDGRVSLNVVGTEGEITEVTDYTPCLTEDRTLAAGAGVYDFTLPDAAVVR